MVSYLLSRLLHFPSKRAVLALQQIADALEIVVILHQQLVSGHLFLTQPVPQRMAQRCLPAVRGRTQG